ncbi:MAG: serine/threonine-protein kinase [Myxococcota bacterium]
MADGQLSKRISRSSGLLTSAGRRFIPRLATTGGRVAWIGLLASLATIGFALYLQFLLEVVRTIAEPLAQATVRLDGALAETTAELRGWIAYRDPAAKTSRGESWKTIDESIATIEGLTKWAPEEFILDVNELTRLLRRIRAYQDIMQELAHSPGNLVASDLYRTRLEPLKESALELLVDPLRLGSAASSAEVVSVGRVIRFRSMLLALDAALVAYLREPTESVRAEIDTRRQGLATLSEELRLELAPLPTTASLTRNGVDESAAMLKTARRELAGYLSILPEVLDARTGPTAVRTEHLFRTRLRPLLEQATQITQRIAAQQTAGRKRSAGVIYRWSFIVIALALAMGIASGFSIYVSNRLERGVDRILKSTKSLGNYHLESLIGRGGMGEVYRGRHSVLRRPCALKILRREHLRDPQAQERFRQEVQMTSSLRNPHTVAIYDYGSSSEGLFYYAMELLDGFTLASLLESVGPLPPRRVVHVLRDVASSLSEAHERGLLHRDIKPSNVMLTQLGGIYDFTKVLDFGLVAEFDQDLGRGRTIVGTPMYLAPECIAPDTRRITPAVDIYAIGALGYELVTGTPVFPYRDVSRVLDAHATESPERLSSRLGKPVPDDLEVLLLGCLAKSPWDRPESAASLEALLAELNVGSWTQLEASEWWQTFGDAARVQRSYDDTKPVDLSTATLELSR